MAALECNGVAALHHEGDVLLAPRAHLVRQGKDADEPPVSHDDRIAGQRAVFYGLARIGRKLDGRLPSGGSADAPERSEGDRQAADTKMHGTMIHRSFLAELALVRETLNMSHSPL